MIFLVIFCIVLALYSAILNASTIPLCIIDGMILYELKKMNQ